MTPTGVNIRIACVFFFGALIVGFNTPDLPVSYTHLALVIFITLALAGCALLSLHMGVIPVPWRALLTDWQAGRCV